MLFLVLGLSWTDAILLVLAGAIGSVVTLGFVGVGRLAREWERWRIGHAFTMEMQSVAALSEKSIAVTVKFRRRVTLSGATFGYLHINGDPVGGDTVLVGTPTPTWAEGGLYLFDKGHRMSFVVSLNAKRSIQGYLQFRGHTAKLDPPALTARHRLDIVADS